MNEVAVAESPKLTTKAYVVRGAAIVGGIGVLARYYAIQWGRAKRTMPETADAQSVLRSFINSTYTPKDAAFVKVVGNTNNLPEPKIDKEELTAHVGAWTFWWPAYAVSLILGDLLTEVFRVISDFLITISGRFVNMAFKGVFK